MMSGKDEAVARTAVTAPKPVKVEMGYPWGSATFYDLLSLDQKIELASRKPLGAYVARRFPEGWRWVPGGGRIGPKMALVAEYVADNPGCCKAEAAWGAGLSSKAPYGGTWGPVERAISSGLVTAEYAHRNRYRLFACGFDRRAFYGETPESVADSYWRPGHP